MMTATREVTEDIASGSIYETETKSVRDLSCLGSLGFAYTIPEARYGGSEIRRM